MSLTFILSPKWGAADRMISGERGRLAGYAFVLFGEGAEKSGRGARAPQQKKAQRAKHTSDPFFPAPGTLLSTALSRGTCNST